MNRRDLRRLRGQSLLVQVSVGIILVGLVTLVTTTGLSSFFLERHLADQQKALIVHQAEALGSCSARVSVPRSLSRRTRVARIIDAALAGTPVRRAIVVDGRGKLRYASAFPPGRLQMLLTRLRHDLRSSLAPRAASTGHSLTIRGTLVAEIITSCTARRRGRTGQTAGILITESSSVVDTEWNSVLLLELLVGITGVALVAVTGVYLGRAIVQPVRKVTSAARAIAEGDHNQRVAPEGPAEAQDLATAFNTMVDELARRRRLDHDLLANISHELAAPLSLIQGYAEGLASGIISTGEHRSAALRAISDESQRLQNLTGSLLDLALLETGEVTIHLDDVPVGELLLNLGARFSPAAEQHGIRIEVDVPPVLPSIRTDGLRLEQILVNLLNNALSHVPERGTITVSARPASEGLSIAVADTGIGIPPEDLSRIWERFYQVDNGRNRRGGNNGLGLGLAICRSTIRVLGGRIDVESVVGQGTTFRLWVPRNHTRD